MKAAGIVEEMASAAALFAAACFLTFLVGLVAGINVAFVGGTFSLLIGQLLTNIRKGFDPKGVKLNLGFL